MINLTKKQATKIILENGSLVAEEVHEPKVLFDSKYLNKLGDVWMLGEVEGILVSVKWFDKVYVPYGQVVFKLPYKIELKRRKDKKIHE